MKAVLTQWSLILLCFSMAAVIGSGLTNTFLCVLHRNACLEWLLLHTGDADFSADISGFTPTAKLLARVARWTF